MSEFNWIAHSILLFIPFLIAADWWSVVLLPQHYGQRAGLATLSLILVLFSKQNIAKIYFSFLFGVCLASSPTIFLLLPMTVWSTKHIRSFFRFIFFMLAGYLFIKILGIFYTLRPEFIVHRTDPGKFSTSIFNEIVRDPSRVIQIKEIFTAIVFFSAVGTIAPFFNHKNKKINPKIWFYWLVSIFGIFVISVLFLLTSKIGDASESFTFSFWRFWTALPFAMLLLTIIWNKEIENSQENSEQSIRFSKNIAVFIFCLIFFVFSMMRIDSFLQAEAERQKVVPTPVPFVNRASLYAKCEKLKYFSGEEKVFIQLTDREDPLAYACFAISDVEIINADFERRTWLKTQLLNKGYREYLLHN